MIVYNLIFWAGCPSGAPHAPCKSSGVRFLWLAGLFFPCPLLTGSWLSRELLSEDSPETVPPKNLQFGLDQTKCYSQGQAPIHSQFWGIGSGSGMFPAPVQCVCTSPSIGTVSQIRVVPSPRCFTWCTWKKAVQHSPQWISIIFRILLISARVVSSHRPGGMFRRHQQPFYS